MITSGQIRDRQQRLSGWRIAPGPIPLALFYLTIAVVFIAYGAVMLQETLNVVEIRKRYDDIDACKIGKSSNVSCVINLEVTSHMDSPIFVYYEIKGMYQNHRRYAKSRDVLQLLGYDRTKSDVRTYCQPVVDMKDLGFNETNIVGDPPANPCGLIAKSYFNDTYKLFAPGEPTDVVIHEDDITWDVDREDKYKRPDDYESKQWTDVKDGIIHTEHFMVWMSIAGLPNFRKLWGRIETDMPKGTYSMRIMSNYDVSGFSGEKLIVLSTTCAFGGKIEFLVNMTAKAPAALLQLKQENEQLRGELRKLSAALDEVLSKQTKKATNPEEAREKELKNLKTQVQNSENALAKLRQQLEMNSTDRAVELERDIAATTQQIREKETAIRNQAREQKQKGDRLDELANGPAQLKEITILTDDIKVRRHKVEKLEATIKQEEDSHSRVRKRITEIEEEIKRQRAIIPGENDDAEPSKPPVAKSDIEELKDKCGQMEKERETKLNEWRRKIADMEGKVKEAEERKEKAKTESSGKEQSARILENKVKELKRNVHVLQRQNESLSKKISAPDINIDPEAVANSGVSKEDQATKSLRKSQESIQSKPDLGY